MDAVNHGTDPMLINNRIYRSLLRRFNSPRFNDIFLRTKNIISEGNLGLGTKAAIYLIFPKSGLLNSQLIALRFMIENGYSPIVVSNLPLSDHDLEQLQPLTYRTLQRENFGYDFGGYREGILVFQDQIKTLDHLALFNDSVWFPLAGARNWLQDAEATGWDFVGSGSHAALRWDDLIDYFQRLKALKGTQKSSEPVSKGSWIEYFLDQASRQKAAAPLVQLGRNFMRRVRYNRKFHYNAFALLLGKEIIGNAGFYDFFKRMKISSNKYKTIVRGEIGFSHWAVSQGYSHGATLHNDDLTHHIAQLDDEALELCWQSQNFPLWRGFFELMQLELAGLPINQFNRAQKEVFMDMINHHYPFPFVAAHYIIRSHGYGFLKKSIPYVRQSDLLLFENLMASRRDPLKSEVLTYFKNRYDKDR
jgi:hypothetical protein